tara:strand:- start:170 stop:340 length:171 start_codon:yes stop_codon:yes gene_type:complete
MNKEQQEVFEMHCRDDIFFFCPLCDMFHQKIRDVKTGQLRGHSLCQMPLEEEMNYE